MKVLLLNTLAQEGGAARACYRLTNGLIAAGVNATLLLREDVDLRHSATHRWSPLRFSRFRTLLEGAQLRFYPGRIPHNFSPANIPGGVGEVVKQLQPDLVHLHWIPQGFVTVEDIASLPCPIVWTLHDSWPFTGGCHLPGECHRYEVFCGCCPVLGSSRARDLSRRGWLRRRRSYPVDRMTFVAPSQWMAARMKTSSLLSGCSVEVIPNGVDAIRYAPGDKAAARTALGLPRERKIILFGAKSALSDPNKGADLLLKTLGNLPAEERRVCTLVLFGEDQAVVVPPIEMEVLDCGKISDEANIAALYRAADVFVMTSRQENLPNMISEAMACGLPCAAFEVGGIPEQIIHRQTGCIAPAYDTGALAAEISWLLKEGDAQSLLPHLARARAIANYSLESVARQHRALYKDLLELRGSHVSIN